MKFGIEKEGKIMDLKDCIKIGDYKGYEIRLDGFRRFMALKEGESYLEDAYSKLTEKIDKLVKAETKTAPIPVLTTMGWREPQYITGYITSFNNEEESAWFISDAGKRNKLTSWLKLSSSQTVYKANEANLAIAARIRQLTIEKEALEVKISSAKYEFTDRIKIGEIVL